MIKYMQNIREKIPVDQWEHLEEKEIKFPIDTQNMLLNILPNK